MPRDMFGDVVDPSIKVGSQEVVHGPAVDPRACGDLRGGHHHSLDGGRCAADAAVDDGVRRGAAAATATAAAPPAARQRRRQRSAGAGRQSERGAGRGAEGNQARKRPRSHRRSGVAGGVEGGVPGGVVGGVVGGLPKPRRLRRRPAAPVRVGGNIKPPDEDQGRQAGLSADRAVGARVRAWSSSKRRSAPTARCKDAKVLRSIPLLDQAALDAVKQWQFTPTLLNGVPVPVIMTVTVNFTLQ